MVDAKRSKSPSTDEENAQSREKRLRHDEKHSSAIEKKGSLFLDALPSAARYQYSLMHRDVLTFVILTPGTNFILTSSCDGYVKFWKKQEQGIEFVKQYRAHLAPVVGLCCSVDGTLAASISSDGTAKVYDVINFGAIFMSSFFI